MQGIKDIASFIFWVDNKKAKAIQAAIDKKRELSKEKLLIMNQVNQRPNSTK